MSPLLLRRVGGALFAADEETARFVRKVPNRGTVAVKASGGRSHKQNAMYWRVLERVVAATGLWHTAEELHVALKVATGYVEVVRLVDGRLIKVPQSIAFDKMAHEAAQAYYDAAYKILCDEVMAGVSLEELLEHIGLEGLDVAA